MKLLLKRKQIVSNIIKILMIIWVQFLNFIIVLPLLIDILILLFQIFSFYFNLCNNLLFNFVNLFLNRRILRLNIFFFHHNRQDERQLLLDHSVIAYSHLIIY